MIHKMKSEMDKLRQGFNYCVADNTLFKAYLGYLYLKIGSWTIMPKIYILPRCEKNRKTFHYNRTWFVLAVNIEVRHMNYEVEYAVSRPINAPKTNKLSVHRQIYRYSRKWDDFVASEG